jgi:phytoene dehydrogenase-like protein
VGDAASRAVLHNLAQRENGGLQMNDHTQAKRKIPWVAWLPATLAPFILYFVLAGSGQLVAGILAGLLAALALNGARLIRRQTKLLELVLVPFFLIHLLVTVGFQATFFRQYDGVILEGVMALVAWGGLLIGSPFTLEYARDDYPRELWHNPQFVLTNQIITIVWACVFTLITLVGLASASGAALPALVTNWLPALLTVLGFAGTLALPKWLPRLLLARDLQKRDPYPWPAPVFHPGFRRPGGNQHDAIIIGSGLGGLSAGALLAQRGLKVLVAEQHFEPGGYCTSWERGVRRGNERLRYVFDAGVHDISGLGPHGPVRNLLRQLNLEGRLDMRRMGHEYILPDMQLKVPEDAAQYVAELQRHFPAEAGNIAAFFDEMQAVYRELYADVDKMGGVPGAPQTVDAMLAYPAEHPHVMRWMERSFPAMLDTFFQTERLKEVLSMLTGYLTDDPANLGAVSMAPIFGYYFDGGYYPAGGSQALSNALVDVINANGGEVRLRTPVQRILVEQGRAVGVELGKGETHCAEAVISNADVQRTLLDMVGRAHLPTDYAQQVAALKPATSAFMVFLGVDIVPDRQPLVSYWAENEDDSIGMMIPSLVDPSLAPPGHASLTLMNFIHQPEATNWDRQAPGYLRRKRAYGDRMIESAERLIPNLREHIIYRQDATPATFARYTGATAGSIYGFARHATLGGTAKTPVERLYLTGSGVMGAGVEAVVISGMQVANEIYRA